MAAAATSGTRECVAQRPFGLALGERSEADEMARRDGPAIQEAVQDQRPELVVRAQPPGPADPRPSGERRTHGPIG